MFKIRSGQRGVALRLHELEEAIMDVVWNKRLASFAVADVLAVLVRQRDIAYTTVMTTVSRLYEKGLLTRTKDGKRYLYSAKLDRAQFLEASAREVLAQSVAVPQAIAMLAEKVSEASAGDLDELEALIRRRRKALGQ